jgi:adenylate cyclase
LARLNAHRREFIEPTIAEHHGRVVKRTGDGIVVEFSSAVDAARCAIQMPAEVEAAFKPRPLAVL